MKPFLHAILILSFLSVASVGQTPTNLLADAGFEEWAGDPDSPNWAKFGQVFSEAITPRTKHFVVKLFGNFTGASNYSGIYQDVPAVPGRRYEASAHLRQNSKDHLKGKCRAWIKLEFFDETHTQRLAEFESPTIVDAKGHANNYVFLSTGPCPAPRGTVYARFVGIFEQGADNAPGAILVDDASLKEIPGRPLP